MFLGLGFWVHGFGVSEFRVPGSGFLWLSGSGWFRLSELGVAGFGVYLNSAFLGSWFLVLGFRD